MAWTVQNRWALNHKGILRKLYTGYYDRLVGHLSKVPGATLEIGSGGGFFKKFCPEAITSDVLNIGEVGLILDGERLPFSNGSLANIAFIGVLHHLEAPYRLFEEARRTLAPGGRMVFTEPYVSYLSYPIYKYLHHESFSCSGSIRKSKGENRPLGSADLIFPTVLFRERRGEFERRFPDFRVLVVQYHDIFLYLLAGGTNYRSFLPKALFPPLRAVERLLSPAAEYLAMFMTLVIEKRET